MDDQRAARITGGCYVGLALSGGLGFMLVRNRLFDADDPARTLAHLVDRPGLATAGVVLELLVVLTQALAAAGFVRVFRRADPWLAAAIGAFGLVNSTVVLGSAAMLATARQAADDGNADLVQLCYRVSGNLWSAGGVFFGLWLLPMGLCVLRSGTMPVWLGRVLVVGACGYVLNPFVTAVAPDASGLADLVTLPATVGEFWMIGALLLGGPARAASPQPAATASA